MNVFLPRSEVVCLFPNNAKYRDKKDCCLSAKYHTNSTCIVDITDTFPKIIVLYGALRKQINQGKQQRKNICGGFYCFVFCFKSGSYKVSQIGLGFSILLPQPFQYRHYRHVLTHWLGKITSDKVTNKENCFKIIYLISGGTEILGLHYRVMRHLSISIHNCQKQLNRKKIYTIKE